MTIQEPVGGSLNASGPAALFTWTSLASLQGSVAVALLVPNVLSRLVGPAFDKYAKWVSFGLSLAIQLLVASTSGSDANTPAWGKWLIAVLNGFLVYASAAGINTGVSGYAKAGKWFRPWFGRKAAPSGRSSVTVH